MNESLKNSLYQFATSPTVLRLMRPLGLYPMRGSHSHHLLRVLRQKRIDCVFDVGAHYGEFGSLLRKIGFEGHILSFEPVADSYKRVQAAAAGDDRWKTFNFALGSSDSSTEIHLYESSFFNSMLPPSGEGERFDAHMRSKGTETIQIRKLDSVFADVTPFANARFFLKMDTQGYDIEVFRGASASLVAIHGLQSELPGVCHYDGQPLMGPVLSEYWSTGFRPTGFFPIHHELDGLTVVEWDCILMRAAESGS